MRRAVAALATAAVAAAVTGCGSDSAASAPAGAHPQVVWAVGDGAAGTPQAAALARRIRADHPSRVLYLGDVYESGTPQEFAANMAGTYRGLLGRTLPTPGNHDWPAHRRGYDPFWRRITGRPTRPWYAVRLAGWQVLSLNSEAPHAPGGPQLRWLAARLRERGAGTCRLAFWHRPRFSAGRHGDQRDVAPLWDAVAGRAALVLGGHDHDLQRLRPVRGTTEIVSGAGGRDLYPVDATDRRLAFADDEHVGALRIALTRGSAVVEVVDVNGRRLDRARVRCG